MLSLYIVTDVAFNPSTEKTTYKSTDHSTGKILRLSLLTNGIFSLNFSCDKNIVCISFHFFL